MHVPTAMRTSDDGRTWRTGCAGLTGLDLHSVAVPSTDAVWAVGDVGRSRGAAGRGDRRGGGDRGPALSPDWSTNMVYVGLDVDGTVDVWTLVNGTWTAIRTQAIGLDASSSRNHEHTVVTTFSS